MRISSLVSRLYVSAATLTLLSGCSSPSSSSPSPPAAQCANELRDEGELGVDCGGSCPNPCTGASPSAEGGEPLPPSASNGVQDGDETDVDCGGSATKCADERRCKAKTDCGSNYCDDNGGVCREAPANDKQQNGLETDVDCGGGVAPACTEGLRCVSDTDCGGACSYAQRCVDAPSCKARLGGDTCGTGEVGAADTKHESCCKTLPVTGYVDPRHPGKSVFLDKYEITAGRVRAFLAAITARYGGKPDVRAWVQERTPEIWDARWNAYLPAEAHGDVVRVSRFLLGDRRPDTIYTPVPAEDQDRRTGLDFQFNGALFVYMHGNNCSTHAPDAYGFPTWFYPPEVLAKMNDELTFPPRADGVTAQNVLVPAAEHLDVKAMNCISNALLQAFCTWDGGQLATDDVLDHVTGSPPRLGDGAGCGTQSPQNPPESGASTSGGRCADLAKINATYDAGGTLPLPDHPLNANRYGYPYFAQDVAHDKAWQVSAPGRGSSAAGGAQVDVVRIQAGDEPWVDLAGNLNEAVLTMDGAEFSGRFGLKYRGLGYQSARSELNTTRWDGEDGLRRIERPEARAAFAGGRCMRFR